MASTHIIAHALGPQGFGSQAHWVVPTADGIHWQETDRIQMQIHTLHTPWEVARAKALGLTGWMDEAQSIPWAAFESGTLGQACAWFHPCHLDVGMTDMVLRPAHELALSEAQSRELLALIAPLAQQDGITLSYHTPDRWLALGDVFAETPCASLARAQGGGIAEWLPNAGERIELAKLARLQSEAQMLLYTHPINEARSASGLPTVNSFWIDGTGLLQALPEAHGRITLDTRLQNDTADAELYGSAWAACWQDWQRQAEQALMQGEAFFLTLCGQAHAMTWLAQRPAWAQRLRRFFGVASAPNLGELK